MSKKLGFCGFNGNFEHSGKAVLKRTIFLSGNQKKIHGLG